MVWRRAPSTTSRYMCDVTEGQRPEASWAPVVGDHQFAERPMLHLDLNKIHGQILSFPYRPTHLHPPPGCVWRAGVREHSEIDG